MRKNSGTSLLELMIVLALLVVIVTLITTQVHMNRALQIRAELDELQAICYRLQEYALVCGQTQQLYVDVEKNCYRYLGHTHTFAAPVRFGILSGVKGPPSAPQHLLTTATTFAKDVLLFYPDGTIQSGTVYLTDGVHELYALSSGVAAVSFLRKYRYAGVWQLLED